MKRKILLLSLICILASSLILTGCNGDDTTPTSTTSTPTAATATPVEGGDWWDVYGEPQYGGKLIVRVDEFSSLQFNIGGPPAFTGKWLFCYDDFFCSDWTLDRSVWDFKTNNPPMEYMVGCLVETWEQPDLQTAVLHLRQGVHFQDIPPANGRELVAADIVYHFNRFCGTGDGYTEPQPFALDFANTYFQSATADDDYTVTIKFRKPSVLNMVQLMGMSATCWVVAPEVTQQGGDLADWHNAIGTGPWILESYVEGSSLNYVRNPNYWGYDERHPENQLPYADELSVIVIADSSTAGAALRTDQITMLTGVDWKTTDTILDSNPEIQKAAMPKAGIAVLFNLNVEPFTDINVRKAMQLSVDRELIAQAHYGGIVDGTPSGQIHPIFKNYAYTYDEWSQELKDEYSYNPEKAKQILADAGFPEGFSTTMHAPTVADMALAEILKSMFMDIGVDMEIKPYDMAAYTQLIMTAKHEGMAYADTETGAIANPWFAVTQMSSYTTNPSTVNDPVYDEMCLSTQTAADMTEMGQITKACDKYALEHHWKVSLFPVVVYNLYQPYLRGYSGELVTGLGGYMGDYARWWIAE